MKQIVFIFSSFVLNSAFSQQVFNNFSEFLKYTDTQSVSLKNSSIKDVQAKKAQLAAKIGIIDPQIALNGSFTNNLQLPVTLLPGEAFGQPGTTQALQMGSPYATNVSSVFDVKLFNFEGIQNYNLSKINIEINTTDANITKKSLYENIAVAYYNIVLLNEQLKATKSNIAISDSLYQITQNKYKNGLIKQQDVNDSKVNLISLQENEKQLSFQLEQTYISLKILADIPENENITIDEAINEISTNQPLVLKNGLTISYANLKEKYAFQEYEKQKKSSLPTLSLTYGFQSNHYSPDFKITGNEWFNSQNLGLKLNVPIPNSQKIANRFNAKYNYELAQQSSKQAEIKAELDSTKLSIEWSKAFSQLQTNAEIANIQTDTYHKNKNLYLDGIQSLDRTLNSLNSKVNAEYNVNSSKVALQLAKAKIDINNQIN